MNLFDINNFGLQSGLPTGADGNAPVSPSGTLSVEINEQGEKVITGEINGRAIGQTVNCNGNGVIIFNPDNFEFIWTPLELPENTYITNI